MFTICFSGFCSTRVFSLQFGGLIRGSLLIFSFLCLPFLIICHVVFNRNSKSYGKLRKSCKGTC
uniref:Uncharacterized protein n=1 Tax=Octopus bimaculoides TaxID=37653 RepID=A0A0L8I5D4_OCTBM